MLPSAHVLRRRAQTRPARRPSAWYAAAVPAASRAERTDGFGVATDHERSSRQRGRVSFGAPVLAVTAALCALGATSGPTACGAYDHRRIGCRAAWAVVGTASSLMQRADRRRGDVGERPAHNALSKLCHSYTRAHLIACLRVLARLGSRRGKRAIRRTERGRCACARTHSHHRGVCTFLAEQGEGEVMVVEREDEHVEAAATAEQTASMSLRTMRPVTMRRLKPTGRESLQTQAISDDAQLPRGQEAKRVCRDALWTGTVGALPLEWRCEFGICLCMESCCRRLLASSQLKGFD